MVPTGMVMPGVMASVLLVVVVMMVLLVRNMNRSNGITSGDGTRAGSGSPLAAAVRIVKQ